MEALAVAMAPIYYSLIVNAHYMTTDDIPAVYRSAYDDYVAKKAEKSAE
jgi:hypothetical protein